MEEEAVHSDLIYPKNFRLLLSRLYSEQFIYALPLNTPVSLPCDLCMKARTLRIREINQLATVHASGDGGAGVYTQRPLSSRDLVPQQS